MGKPEKHGDISMSEKRKPRLLIIGHGRHGKDTVAQMIADKMGLTFSSSSDFVGRKAIWPMWGQERYDSYEAMFEDRVNFRSTWSDLIEAYNTPDASRTGSEMIAEGNDMYVGMRRVREWKACIENKVFDHVIWVDACERLPLEGPKSMEMKREHADLFVDNNGPEENLAVCVDNLQILLKNEGYDVGVPTDVIIGPGGIAPEEFQEPELEDRLEWTDKPTNAIQVLDHGFFEVKSVMNSDAEIAESARMSYGRGTKKVNNDGGLINYLVRNHHTSPLEMGEIMFHMRLPIFVMRQLVRHRTANLNEYSGRYSEMVRLFYVPDHDKIMYQGLVNKQMSGEPLPADEAEKAIRLIINSSNDSFDVYEELLRQDVSRETARIILPLNTYTECVWKLDVSNLIKFLYLRDDDHAQWEIRVYARLIGEAVERFFPMVYASYMRERESVKLTQIQIEALIQGVVSLDDMSKSECAQVADILANYD
jgi:thymidylate synthase (FAD)